MPEIKAIASVVWNFLADLSIPGTCLATLAGQGLALALPHWGSAYRPHTQRVGQGQSVMVLLVT